MRWATTLVFALAPLFGCALFLDPKKAETQASNSQTPGELLLVYDIRGKPPTLPPAFRTTLDLRKLSAQGLPTTGMRTLNASGSGQFSVPELRAALKSQMKGKVFVVDLREESHGFVNDEPVSWFGPRDWSNVGKTLSWIRNDEHTRLANLLEQKNVHIDYVEGKLGGVVARTRPVPTVVSSAATEEQVVRGLGLAYLRIAVTGHRSPQDEDVDAFLGFVRRLPPDAWVHFHCHGGDGRATSFLAMYDSIRNAKQVSVEDIVERQKVWGGYDLFDLGPKKDYKYADAVKRAEFIRKFHEFVKSGAYDAGKSWSEWSKEAETRAASG